jgi:hypothetical protein
MNAQFKKTLKPALAFFILLSSFNSCKKTDIDNSDLKPESVNFETNFFRVPVNTPAVATRIAETIRKQNEEFHFVNRLALKEGLPVWDKAQIQLHKKIFSPINNVTNSTTNGLNEEDTLVILPLVLQNTDFVNSFLACSVGDSISIRLISARDYASFGFDNNTDSINGDRIALETMILEKIVFGHDEFELTDRRLLKHTENGITINPSHVKLSDPDSAIVPMVQAQITTCVQVTSSGGDLIGCPPGEHCNGLVTYEECSTWTIYEGSPGGGNGNCTSCVQWWVPVAGNPGGSGSIGWYHTPELTAEQLADSYWCTNGIKDSTINNCVSEALTGLKNINAKLPRLIRNFFETSGTPSFQMHIKMENLSIWQQLANNTWAPPEGAHTSYNTNSSSFNVFINGYYADATDLANAATIIHEALHCQLMNWFREAYVLGDTVRRNQLAYDYGYIFTDEVNHQDSSVRYIVQGLDPAQHQHMANRYRDTVAQALYQFALSKNIPASLNYCKDIAWAGCLGSQAFHSLTIQEQERIIDRIAAEKDPLSNLINPDTGIQYNSNDSHPKGHSCHNNLEL